MFVDYRRRHSQNISRSLDDWCPNEFELVIANHAEQCGKQVHVAGSARSNSAPGVRGHLQDRPCHLLVARGSLKSVAQQFDPANGDRIVIDVAIHAALVSCTYRHTSSSRPQVSVTNVANFAEIGGHPSITYRNVVSKMLGTFNVPTRHVGIQTGSV